jgi:hypothetical protein
MVVGTTSPVCSEGNAVTSKAGASVILKTFLEIEIDESSLLDGNERGVDIETVVPAHDYIRRADRVVIF